MCGFDHGDQALRKIFTALSHFEMGTCCSGRRREKLSFYAGRRMKERNKAESRRVKKQKTAINQVKLRDERNGGG